MKSLITSVPWSPILRSRPPVAFLLRCLRGVADSSAPSLAIVLVT